jgi:hypothetical protein
LQCRHEGITRSFLALSDQHRVWLTELSRAWGKRATLDDIPDAELDRLAELGFGWVWFLSVWQTGAAAQEVSRGNAGWRKEFQETLPDLREEDIGVEPEPVLCGTVFYRWQRSRSARAMPGYAGQALRCFCDV